MDNQELKSKQSKKFDFTWVIIITSAFMIFVVLGLCSSSKSLFLGYIIDYTGLKRGPYGLTNTFRYITTSIVNIFFGYLVLKLGVKMLVGLGFLSLAGSMVLFAVSSELWSFYIAGVLLGVAVAWTTTTMVGYIVNKWVKKNRGTVMGFILATNGLGSALAVNIYTPILEASPTGYKTAYFIIAAMAIILGIVTVIFIKDRKLGDDEKMPTKKQKGDNWVGIDFKTATRKSYFYWTMICVFMTGLVLQSITTVFQDHMKIAGISDNFRTIITTVYSVILTCTKFLTGFMYDRKGLRFTMTMNYICAVISMLMLALINPSPLGIVFCFIYAVTVDIALPLETIMLPIYAGDLFGRKEYAKFLGICVSVNTAGYALGSPLMGFVCDAFGSYVPAFFVSAGIMVATVIIMHFVITSANKEKKRIEKELTANAVQVA